MANDALVRYTPKAMLAAMRQTPRPTTFLQDLFVGTRDFHDKKNIQIDKVIGPQAIARYTNRQGAPNAVGKAAYTSLLHFAPYSYEEVTYTGTDVDIRGAGVDEYGPSGRELLNRRMAGWLNDLQDRQIRLEEQQVAQALQTGEVTVAGVDTNYTVDYGQKAAHLITLAGGDVWGSGSEDKIAQWEAQAQIIMDTGAPAPNVIVMDLNSAQLALKDTAILANLDNRRVERGEINIRTINDQRATYLGNFRANGLDVDLYSYQGMYTVDAGSGPVTNRYITADNYIMGSTSADFRFHYGKIESLRSNFVGRMFPNMWEDPDGRKGHITMESAPLAGFHQTDAFIRVNVK